MGEASPDHLTTTTSNSTDVPTPSTAEHPQHPQQQQVTPDYVSSIPLLEEWKTEYDAILNDIAATSHIQHQWPFLKTILRTKIHRNILPDLTLTSPESVQSYYDRILVALESLEEPPFTLQRLCELLQRPTENHKTIFKYLRALEKVLLVTSLSAPVSFGDSSISLEASESASSLFTKTSSFSNNVSVPTQIPDIVMGGSASNAFNPMAMHPSHIGFSPMTASTSSQPHTTQLQPEVASSPLRHNLQNMTLLSPQQLPGSIGGMATTGSPGNRSPGSSSPRSPLRDFLEDQQLGVNPTGLTLALASVAQNGQALANPEGDATLVSGIVGFPMDIDVNDENNNIEINANSLMANLGITPAPFPLEDSILTEFLEPLEPIDTSELVGDDVEATDLEEIQHDRPKNADNPTTPTDADQPPTKIQRTSSLQDIYDKFRQDDVDNEPGPQSDMMQQQFYHSPAFVQHLQYQQFLQNQLFQRLQQLQQLPQQMLSPKESFPALSENQDQQQDEHLLDQLLQQSQEQSQHHHSSPPKVKHPHNRLDPLLSPKDQALQQFIDIIDSHFKRDLIYSSQLIAMRVYRDLFLKPAIMKPLNATIDAISNNTIALNTALMNFQTCISNTLNREFTQFDQSSLSSWDLDTDHHNQHDKTQQHNKTYNIFEFSITPASLGIQGNQQERRAQQLASFGTNARSDALIIYEWYPAIFITRTDRPSYPIRVSINLTSTLSPTIVQILVTNDIQKHETELSFIFFNKYHPNALIKHENISINGRITDAEIGVELQENSTVPYRTKNVIMFATSAERAARLATNIPHSGKSLSMDFFHRVLAKIAQLHPRELLGKLKTGGSEVSGEEQTDVTVREMWKWVPGLREEVRKLSACVEMGV